MSTFEAPSGNKVTTEFFKVGNEATKVKHETEFAISRLECVMEWPLSFLLCLYLGQYS